MLIWVPIYTIKRDGEILRDQYLVRVWVSGTPKTKTFFGTKKEAEKFEARWRLELDAVGPADIRTAPLFSTFSIGRYSVNAERNLGPQTWTNRRYQVAVLAEFFCQHRIDAITPSEVEAFRNARRKEGIGAVKINDDVKVLIAILNYAKHIGYPARVPKISRLREPKTKGRVKVWTDKEVGKLYKSLEKLAPHLLPITVVMMNAGLRKGEALNLQWPMVDVKRRLIKIYPNEEWRPKDNEPREVPLSDACLPYLNMPIKSRRHSRWVFPSTVGNVYARWPQRDWDAARRAAKIGGSPHVCRHTYASHFLAACPDLYLLSQILGHSHSRVTQLYAHLLPDHLKRAQNVVNLSPK